MSFLCYIHIYGYLERMGDFVVVVVIVCLFLFFLCFVLYGSFNYSHGNMKYFKNKNMLFSINIHT
jgi:TRAP-type C4-dicarboxylate transport system permease small subunit